MEMPAAEEASKYRCTLCNLTHAVESGRVHGRKFTCTPCASADGLLRRGLGSKDELQNLSVEEQHSFFQKLAVEKANTKDSRIDWKYVPGAHEITDAKRLDQSVSPQYFRSNDDGSVCLLWWKKRLWHQCENKIESNKTSCKQK